MFLRLRRSNGVSILAVTVDEFFNLVGLLELPQNFVHLVYMEKAFDCVPWGVLWGTLQAYSMGYWGHYYEPFGSVYKHVRAVFSFYINKSVQWVLDHSCPLSPIMFVIFKDRI